MPAPKQRLTIPAALVVLVLPLCACTSSAPPARPETISQSEHALRDAGPRGDGPDALIV